MQNHYFIRIRGEVGWVYVLGYVDGQSAFINELVPGDFILYVNGHSFMRPITWKQYKEIYDSLTDEIDPAAIVSKTLQNIAE